MDFWESFCQVLTKSAHLGFLGSKSSGYLKEVCRNVVPPTQEVYNASYRDCRDIKLEDNNHVVVAARYGSHIFHIQLKYPLDYLRLLKSVEREIMIQSAVYHISFQKKDKSPTLSRVDQMIEDFLQSYKEEINIFKRYATEYEEKELLIEKARSIYRELPCIRSLIVDGKEFLERYCGFDIKKKKAEIDAVIKKLNDSIDEGEDKVEYAIKWLCADSSVPFKIIKKNCESKYRYGCIILKNSSFIDEVQEYDHILVSEAGVILIETKHWKGRVEVRSDGKWVRDPNNDGCIEGIESPMYQIQRHEALIKSILPNVPIHSLLVFSNSSLILEGVENCKICRVIYVDKLKETIMHIVSMTKPSGIDIVNYCADEIERHKVNIMQDDIRELN